MKTTFILYENYQTHFAGLYSIVGSFVLHLHATDSKIQIQHLDHMVTTALKGEEQTWRGIPMQASSSYSLCRIG